MRHRALAAAALAGAALTGLVCDGALAPAAAKVLKLSVEQSRALALRAMQAGDAPLADALARGLLQRDPNDFLALLVEARASARLGRTAQARAAARRAWANARTPAQRYDAAMVRAEALDASEMRLAAQFWLRRAADVAPTAATRRNAVAGLGVVRSRSRWAFQFDMSLVPSSNVNGGSENQTMIIFGLPFTLSGDAQALSGLVGSVSGTAVYRLTPRPHSQSEVSLNAVQTHNWLTSSAKAQAPNAKGSNYDYGAVELGFSQQLFESRKSDTALRWGVLAGRNWYGHNPLSDYLRVSGGVTHRLAPRTVGLVDISVERQLRKDDFINSAVVFSGSAGIRHQLANGDVVGLSLGRRYTESQSIQINRGDIFGTLSWDQAKPVAGVRLGAALTLTRRVYNAYPFSSNGRHDLATTASLTAQFTQASYLGFAPTLTLQWQKVHSDVSLYESRNFGIALGIRSVF